MTQAPAVLARLRDELVAALGPRLLGLYVFGSFVSGDFAPARSDLDLLAVLDGDPDDATLVPLGEAHARVEAAHPSWRGRLEVEAVSLAAVGDAAADRDAEHLIARVSPGESLHLLPATSHRVITYASVRSTGRALAGPPPTSLLPVVPDALVDAALLHHVRDWPVWVRNMTGAGGQAYAVLTVCRAHHRLTTGAQVSKRAAADAALTTLPLWADIVAWARDWWYAGGEDDAAPREHEVTAFVVEVCAGLLEDYGPSMTGGGTNGLDLAVLRELADEGDEAAAARLLELAVERGDSGELRALHDDGHVRAGDVLAGLAADRGDVEELRGLVDEGNEVAAERLAEIADERGDVAELRSLADDGHPGAVTRLARRVGETGR